MYCIVLYCIVLYCIVFYSRTPRIEHPRGHVYPEAVILAHLPDAVLGSSGVAVSSGPLIEPPRVLRSGI